MPEATTPFSAEQGMTPWWLLSIQGASAVLLGALLLLVPAVGSGGLAGALGLYWLVAGVLAVVRAFIDHSVWAIKMLTAVLGVGTGVWALGTPISVALPPGSRLWAIGLLGVGIGTLQFAEAFYESSAPLGALAAASVLIGILVAFSPLGLAETLPVVAGVGAIIAGAFATASSLGER